MRFQGSDALKDSAGLVQQHAIGACQTGLVIFPCCSVASIYGVLIVAHDSSDPASRVELAGWQVNLQDH